MNRPYLSIIAVGRNDNYGGDFRSRLQRWIANLSVQLHTHRVSAEVIFVNYNPLVDGVPIEQFIEWPASTENVRIRIVTVPNQIHRQLISDGLRKDVPVMEYMAKNAGLRRADGEFILCMNPDIILTPEVIGQLKQLSEKCYYRADRLDFSGDLNGRHQFERVFMKGHEFPIASLKEIPMLRAKNFLLNTWQSFTPNIAWLLNRLSVHVYYNNIENQIHCNVSGDFMLMHRDHWYSIKGHNEHTAISLHVDALTVVQAHYLGLNEKVFDHPIFHQQHERRYDASVENPDHAKAFEFFSHEASQMKSERSTRIYNSEEWGLSNFDLPELKL